MVDMVVEFTPDGQLGINFDALFHVSSWALRDNSLNLPYRPPKFENSGFTSFEAHSFYNNLRRNFSGRFGRLGEHSYHHGPGLTEIWKELRNFLKDPATIENDLSLFVSLLSKINFKR